MRHTRPGRGTGRSLGSSPGSVWNTTPPHQGHRHGLDLPDEPLGLLSRPHLSYSLPAEQQSRPAIRAGSTVRPVDLSPFLSWWDPRTVGKGNPSLKPQYTDSYEGGYELPFGANSVNAGVYYRVTHDLYQQVMSKFDTSSTVLLMTTSNVGNDYSLGWSYRQPEPVQVAHA